MLKCESIKILVRFTFILISPYTKTQLLKVEMYEKNLYGSRGIGGHVGNASGQLFVSYQVHNLEWWNAYIFKITNHN